MKIAICTDIYLPQLSGVADSIAIMVDEMEKRGHTVRVYAPNLKGVVSDARIVRVPSFALPGSEDTMLIVVPRGMLGSLKAFKPDVIHAHTFSTIGIWAWLAHAFYKIPFVGTDHTFPADYLCYAHLDYAPFRYFVKKFAAWFYGRCVSVTAVSHAMLKELRDYGMRRPAMVVSNPINIGLFRPLPGKDSLKKKFGMTKPTVLVFGRIAVEKNLLFALDVFSELKKSIDAELVFVGEGPYQSELAAKILRDSIPDVRFLGVHRGDDLVGLINAADVCLITSLVESQSMTTLQAMACELPIVAARSGAIPEYVHNGENGFLGEPGDASGFAKDLARVLGDRALANKLGTAGRKSVEVFSSSATADLFEKIYGDACMHHSTLHARIPRQ